jgi:hypothetical protein
MRPNGGECSRNASFTTVRHASARATTDKRLSPIAAKMYVHSTSRKASATSPHSGPRHQSITIAAQSDASTIDARVHVFCRILKRVPRRAPVL